MLQALESFIKQHKTTYDRLLFDHSSLLMQLVLYHVLPTPMLPDDIRKATSGYKKPVSIDSALPLTGGTIELEATKT
jgi:hypothetical protein